jgi:hypothetical protein
MAELNVYTVTSTADTATNPAQGTLRYGLVNAVANSYDKIVFDSTVFPANTQTTILLAAQLEAPARDLIIDGGATWTVNYVWRGEDNNKTRVFIDENNPAQEGEDIKTLLRTRVVLDAQATTYRCLIGAAANKINVSGVTFKRGKLSGSSYGAGVHTRNSAASGKNAFTDCTFDSCTAARGGGLCTSSTSQNTLKNCTFDSCTAATNGGGLFSSNTSQNTLSNCTFDSCAAINGGGLFSSNTSQNTLSNCTFDSCAATYGGGLCTYITSQNTLSNCTFDSCTAATYGGGLFSSTTSQNTLKNCTFDSCTAATYGGGLFSSSTSQNTLENCTFDSCAATYGGGLYLQAASSVLFRTSYDDVNRFVNCEATTKGSAIYNNSFYQFDFNDGIVYTDCEPVNAWNKADQTIRYFSNNADSGTGSLRQAISDASNYDIIEPDSTAFANVDVVEIALSSPIAFNKQLTFRGNGKRVRLNGQKAYRIGNATQAIQFEDFEFVNGYSVSANTGAVFYVTGGYSLELTRCLVAGNYGAKVVYANGNASFVLKSSVMIGNQVNTDDLFANVTQVFIGSTVICNCVDGGDAYQFTSGVDNSLGTTDAPLADFVDAPPQSMPVWDADAWKDWDLRLAADSPYLHGASPKLLDDPNTAFDFFGHQRKLNGAIGAYEGSWVVGGQTITEDTTVDYCDFKSTDTISFTGVDRFLSVKEAAYIDGATFTAENRSYLAVPAIGSIINTSFSDNIRICEYSANVQSITSSISEDVAVFSIVKANEKNIVIDWSTDSGLNWHICVLNESNQVVLTSSKNHIFRVFDGINFVVTDEIPRTYFSADSLKNISLTNSTDWYLDSARTKACNDSPSINSCVFKIQ